MYLYVKALHIVFIVTWFSGLFYIVRLFIYNAEAEEKPEAERNVLRPQFNMMIRRLWYGITWPSAIMTLIFGPWMFYLYYALPNWLMIKLCFVVGLYAYHLSLHQIFKQQMNGVFKWTSQQLRIWNEVATIFLIAIVMLAVVKDSLSAVWGVLGLVLFVIALMSAIRIYKMVRTKQ
jgi:putative membrane protein